MNYFLIAEFNFMDQIDILFLEKIILNNVL